MRTDALNDLSVPSGTVGVHGSNKLYKRNVVKGPSCILIFLIFKIILFHKRVLIVFILQNFRSFFVIFKIFGLILSTSAELFGKNIILFSQRGKSWRKFTWHIFCRLQYARMMATIATIYINTFCPR